MQVASHSIPSPHTQEMLPSIVSAGERCPGSSQGEGFPLWAEHTQGRAGCLLPAGLRFDTGIKTRSLLGGMQRGGRHQLDRWCSGDPAQEYLSDLHQSQSSCQKRQLMVIKNPERRRMRIPVGDFMAQSHLFLGEQKFRGFVCLFVCFFKKQTAQSQERFLLNTV